MRVIYGTSFDLNFFDSRADGCFGNELVHDPPSISDVTLSLLESLIIESLLGNLYLAGEIISILFKFHPISPIIGTNSFQF